MEMDCWDVALRLLSLSSGSFRHPFLSLLDDTWMIPGWLTGAFRRLLEGLVNVQVGDRCSSTPQTV